MKDYNEAFHRQLERSTDSFSLISDYFGRCLFDNVPTDESHQVPKSPIVLTPPKPVVQVPFSSSNMILPLKSVEQNTNPFDEDGEDDNDYDDSKNPFNDDYDESKNPFADFAIMN